MKLYTIGFATILSVTIITSDRIGLHLKAQTVAHKAPLSNVAQPAHSTLPPLPRLAESKPLRLSNAQVTATDKKQIPAEVRFVAAGIENARRNLHCVQLQFTYSQIIPRQHITTVSPQELPPSGESNDGKDQITVTKGNWYFQDGVLSVKVEPSVPLNPRVTSFTRRMVADAKLAKLLSNPYIPKTSINQRYHAPAGVISPSEEVLHDGIWGALPHLDPRYYMYYTNTYPLDQVFVKTKFSPTFEGEVKFKDSKCVKIGVRFNESTRQVFYIDTDHGFIVRRREGYRLLSDKWMLSFEDEALELQKDNNVWFPVAVEMKDYWDLKSASPIIKRYEISGLRVGCNIPKEVFDLDWPIGTVVEDKVKDSIYRVMPVTQKKEVK
jgi:hypothetical protein